MTAEKHTLPAKKRTITGKKVKQLRSKHILPAHIYGTTEPLNIEFDEKTFLKTFEKAGETSLLYVHVEGEKESRPVLVADYMVDPVLGQITHVDLRQVNLNVKVKANVPVEVIGESEAVKAGGVLITLYNEIEVEALPTDLPEKFVLDISKLLNIGDDLKVADLQYDASKVEISIAPTEVLVLVNEPVVEVEAPVTTEPVEVEITAQGLKKEDEAVAAEGGEKKAEKTEKKAEK